MTVVTDHQAVIHRYIGAAADDKPTGVPVGSTFLEYDTDKRYVCYDGTNWAQIDQLSVQLAGENHVGAVGGHTVRVSGTKTRPDDTNAYAAYDAINESASAGTNWTFTGMARVSGGSGTIVDAILLCSDPALVARLEVDLYKANPTAINDNAEGTQLVGNNADYVGTVTFGAAAKPTTNSTVAKAVPATQIRVPFVCGASADLYGIVRTLDADTPIAQAVYLIIFKVYQD